MKNLITRSITGVLFVAIIVTCFMCPEGMIAVFALVTGLTVWEYTGLVNRIDGVTVNRFISTAAGVYLFFAVAGFCSGITPSAALPPWPSTPTAPGAGVPAPRTALLAILSTISPPMTVSSSSTL